MDTPKKVLVLDNSPDLLELNRILLTAEGYEVAGSNYEVADLDLIKSHAPDVILFDLVKDRREPWALLEQLSTDPQTRDIGVMVTSATPALIEKAVSDPTLHVSSGLLMPFDIDDLYARLEEAITHAEAGTPAVTRSPAVQAAAGALGDERRNILFRWVQRISTLEAYRRRPDLELDEAMGEMGALLDALVAGLEEAHLATPRGEGVEALVERHIALRTAQGALPADIVREYQLLRSEVSRTLRGALHLWRLSLADVMLAQQRVDEAIDQLVVLSIDICWRLGRPAATTPP